VKPRKDTQRKKQQRERLDLTIAAVAISATAPTSSLKLLRPLRQRLSQLLNSILATICWCVGVLQQTRDFVWRPTANMLWPHQYTCLTLRCLTYQEILQYLKYI